MRHDSNNGERNRPAWGSLALLAFGLIVLAFLVAIERPHWFKLRPASGTAGAMAQAGAPAPVASPAAASGQ